MPGNRGGTMGKMEGGAGVLGVQEDLSSQQSEQSDSFTWHL